MAFQIHTHALLLALVATLSWPPAACYRVARQAVKQDASTEESVGGRRRRRRRSCNDWTHEPPVAEQSVQCSTSSPGGCTAPQAYTIRRFKGSMTGLGTYANLDAARNVFKSEGTQFELLLDASAEIVDFGNSCGNREHYQAQALTWLTEMTECKYPWGGWVRIFAELSPRSSYVYEEEVTIGMSFSQSNTTSVAQSFQTSVAQGPFTASSSFSYVVSTSSSLTWEGQTSILKRWTVTAGVSVVAWKYVLKSKCYNVVGQFLDEATFETNIQMQTGDLSTPDCDPNVPGQCAALSGAQLSVTDE